jgi:DNA-binding response OmpR family regulator
MSILLVEDGPAAAAMLAKGLREQSYAVDVAGDGRTAAEQAFASDYDLVILDVLLPGRNGVDVCREMFERFYRADTARRRDPQHRGAGLGLAIAKWIAEAHDGCLELVRSTPEGTTFRARLPVVHLLFMVACYGGL